MSENKLIVTDCLDPWHNLALEEHLYDVHRRGVVLFLWRNQNTVVIGRNQNAWKECRLERLEADGGKLARRSTGGGAVFHDLGNLNFSFIAEKALYSEARQLRLIAGAAARLGIRAQVTGRNDIVSEDGAKFSGNAFRHGPRADLHHGTLLISADMDRLARYLAPSREKLRAKGVESVRARVRNLCEYREDISTDTMREALIHAFREEYGPYDMLFEAALDPAAVSALETRHASWQWRLGASPRFDASFARRFSWGDFELQLLLKNGHVESAAVFSDAMDEAFIRSLPPLFTGLPFRSGAFAEALAPLKNAMADDVAAFLKEHF